MAVHGESDYAGCSLFDSADEIEILYLLLVLPILFNMVVIFFPIQYVQDYLVDVLISFSLSLPAASFPFTCI